MKRLLLALGCMAAAAAGSAAAADLPIKMPSAYAPFFTWQGFYVGINAGYGFGHSSWADNVTLLSTGKFDVSGAMVGGTMGYNVQLGGWVLGLEGDAGWSGVKGSTAINCPGGCQTTNEWLGTARGRVGYAFNGLLPYVTGGAAFGDVNASSPGGGTRADMGWGWTGGAGLEYAFAARWSAKVEYLYVDLGKTNCCGNPIDVTFTSNVVRGGVNYKF